MKRGDGARVSVARSDGGRKSRDESIVRRGRLVDQDLTARRDEVKARYRGDPLV